MARTIRETRTDGRQVAIRPRYADSRAAAQREARAIVAELVDYATATVVR